MGSNPIRWIEEKGLAASSRRRTRYRTSEGGGAGFMRWKAVRSCVHAPKFAGRARPCATPGAVLGLLKLHEGARAGDPALQPAACETQVQSGPVQESDPASELDLL